MKKTDVKPFLDSLGNIPEHTKRLYANATAELARREMEALRLYEPLPFQQAYHSSTAKEVVLMKSNRAGGSLAGFAEDARAAMGCDPFDVRRSPDVKFSDTPADKCRKLGAPTGMTMNSWKSTFESACAPPLRMFIIGTGSV
mgnify:CR=1 FL=1